MAPESARDIAYSAIPDTWSWETRTYGTRSRSQVTSNGWEISASPNSASSASSARGGRTGSSRLLRAPVCTVTVTGSGEGQTHGQ